MTKRAFQKIIYANYQKNGRKLPWRHIGSPYRVLVSEIMLQQTQVSAVRPKYQLFIKRFPNFKALAQASFKDIFQIWQGLGYNRRALALQKIAQMVEKDWSGKLPRSVDELATMPGIGRATASAICAFAWNMPTVFVETNIRTVFLHFFFPHREHVSDLELLKIIEHMLDTKNSREWYYALMDYGNRMKRESRSKRIENRKGRKQAVFKGSNRELRGKILRSLLASAQSEQSLVKIGEENRVKKAMGELLQENLIRRSGSRYSLV